MILIGFIDYISARVNFKIHQNYGHQYSTIEILCLYHGHHYTSITADKKRQGTHFCPALRPAQKTEKNLSLFCLVKGLKVNDLG